MQAGEAQISAAGSYTRFPNSLRAKKGQRKPLGHNRTGRMHPDLLGERFSSTALSTRRLSVRAARRWPRSPSPEYVSARLRRRSSLRESIDERAPVGDHFEPAHPIGGGTFRARGGATTLGRPCRGSTGFGRKNAWAELGDYKRQGSDIREQIGQQASLSFPRFPAIYFSTARICMHIEK
jgi:hypothetical protein